MYNHKLKVLFVISATRINKKGLAPLICRITFLGKRKTFSTGLFINPDLWNSKKQEALPPTEENEFINTQLSLISQKINKAFLLLLVQEESFDVDDIVLSFKGKTIKKDKSFLEVLEIHNNRMKKLIGIEYAPRYYEKWEGTQKLLKEFIKKVYDRSDLILSNISIKFLNDLDLYLKTEKAQKQITVNKCIQRVRKIIRLAVSEGFLDKDPFLTYKPKRYKKEVIYLNNEELIKLEKHKFAQNRLERVRDMFVFCCYTGLAYAEMSSLSKEHVIKGYDGHEWINMFRQKTKSEISVPLLPKARDILNRYEKNQTAKLLPIVSNQKFNSYLKEIAEIVGIDKRLTHHIARKTFATTILLYNDVPMEIVSELLGHSKMAITQKHYAKVVKKKIGEHMELLKKKL